MSRFNQPILFDESIGRWRFRTKADDDYAERLVKECFPNTNKDSLQDALSKLAKLRNIE